MKKILKKQYLYIYNNHNKSPHNVIDNSYKNDIKNISLIDYSSLKTYINKTFKLNLDTTLYNEKNTYEYISKGDNNYVKNFSF